MKNKNRLSIMITLLIMIPLFISVVFAIWYISDFKMATPNNKKDNILTKYINNQETTYDGNIQLPSPKVFENGIPLNTDDISYSFKIKDSNEEYVECIENETGPENAGEYLVKVIYDLSYIDISGQNVTDSVEKEITFTIRKFQYDLNGISFSDTTKVYNGKKQSIEISGTLPTGVTVSYEGGGTNVISSPYTVTANFQTPDTINYEQIESKTANLTITPLNITDSNIIISFVDNKDTFAYLESPSTPGLKVLFGDTELTLNTDFSVAYENNTLDNETARKNATATISGMGNFTGTKLLTYSIVRYMYLDQDRSATQSFVYDGTVKSPVVCAYSDASHTKSLEGATFTYSAYYKDSNAKYYSDNQTNPSFYTIKVGAELTGYELFEEITVQYSILQREITGIQWSSERTFTYNGSPQSPTATVLGIIGNDVCDVTIYGIGTDANANPYTATVVNPSNKLKEEILLSNLNYKIPDNLTNKTCDYTINKAKVQRFGGTITIDGEYIEGDEPSIYKKDGYTLYGIIPSGKSQEIISAEISKINYSESKFTDGLTSESQPTSLIITFKTNNSNYEDYVYTASIDIYAVATIGQSYYGTVERALAASKSGDSVYLIPGRNPTIRTDTEIKSGVKLYLVYEKGQFRNNRKSTVNDEKFEFADTNETTNLKNTLNVAKNITLTNNGELYIDGITGYQGQAYAGPTSGSYTQILLDENAKIESNNKIYCLGYIKEKVIKNNSEVNINQGTLSAPLVIYDFKGGSASSVLHRENICPFKIFDMPNVQPTLNIKAGGEYEALTSLWIQSNSEYTLQDGIYIVGKSGNTSALFILESGSVSIKYNYSNNYISSDMNINIKGNCSTGSLKLTLKISSGIIVIPINLDTAKYYCPISYKIKISVDSGSFNVTQKLEFLTGSELIIKSSGKLNITTNCIFYESFKDTYTRYTYPSNYPAAQLDIYGICNITGSFAGIITPKTSNAQLSITNVSVTGITDANCFASNGGLTSTMYYAKCGDTELKNATLYAKGYIDSTASGYKNFQTGSYISNGSYWELKYPIGIFNVTYKYWDSTQNKEVETTCMHNLFETTTEIPLTIDSSATERKFYNIDNWYVVENGTVTEKLYSTITPANGENYTIELVYTPKQYTINYNNVTNENQEDFVNNKTVITYGNFADISIYNPGDITGKTFVGWYLTSDFDLNDTPFVNPGANGEESFINAITQMEDNNINEITLYGKYVAKHKVTVHLSILNSIISGESIIDKEIQIEHGSSLTSSQLSFDIFDKLLTSKYNRYFDNQWTNNESSTDIFDITSKIESDIDLYPILKFKEYTLTIKYKDFYNNNNTLTDTQYYIEDSNSISINEITIDSARYKCKGMSVENESIDINGNNWKFNNKTPSIIIDCYKVVEVTYTDSGGYPEDVSLNENAVSFNSNKLEVCQGDTLKFKSHYNENDNQKTEISVTDFTENNGYYEFTIGSENVTIKIESTENSCIVEGTLISMADGTYKKVEDLKVGDLVKVFNHETGKIDDSYIIDNIHENEIAKLNTIINLIFDNNQVTRISFEHGFFDVDLNEYIYINQDNYKSMIGHRFYSIDGKIITLMDCYISEEIVRVYSPVTYKHLNLFTDNLLSIAGGIYGLFNIFDLNKDMTINIDKFNEDISKYGLYEYDEWSNYMTLEEFESVNFKYFKVAVAKGMITIDELIKIILS